MNAGSTRTISRHIFDWKRRGYSERERTELLKELGKIPLKMFLSILLVCVFYTVFWVLIIYMITKIQSFSDIKIELFDYFYMLLSAIFVGYVIGLVALLRAENVIYKYSCDLVEEGVNEMEFKPGSFAGIPMKLRNRLFLMFPIIGYGIENIIVVEHVFIHYPYSSPIAHIIIIADFILNGFVILLCAHLNQNRGKHFSRSLIMNLTKNIHSSVFSYIPTDLNDDLSYVTFLVNKSNEVMQQVLLKATDTSKEITSSVGRLVDVSSENAASSLQQATSVHQIVEAMEFADSLSSEASSKIVMVTDNIKQNFTNVEEGFVSLNDSIDKIGDISDSNEELLRGIKSLSDQINSIWDIVNIISSIAEQTKIIAFNAELEASSAGEAGKNFHIVANDIRRLAESTSRSTKEIKDRISNIQLSSDELIYYSKGGTVKINEGLRLSNELNKNFESIKESSVSVQQSINEMNEIILKQSSAFTQILGTLKQVSSGIEINKESSHTVNDYAIKLQTMADELYDLKKTSIHLKGGQKNV